MDAEGRQPSAVLDQRYANERRDVVRQKPLALLVRETRVRLEVIDDHRLAFPAGLDDGLAEHRERRSNGQRCDAVGVVTTDDELVALDHRIVDAARAKMLAEQPDGGFFDGDRIPQRPELLVESDQKLPLG